MTTRVEKNTNLTRKKKKKKPTTSVAKRRNDGQIRVPRTAGTTMLCKEIHNTTQNKEKTRLKKSLQENILNRYIQDGFRLNGQTVDITYLAQYLGVPVTRVVKGITKHQVQLAGLTSPENIENTYRALIASTIGGALLDRGRVLEQVDTLKRAQGDSYVPFLSSALNNALKMAVDTHKPIIDLLRQLSPTPTTLVQNTTQVAIDGQVEKYIGPNEAIQMIDGHREEGVNLLTDPEAQQDLHTIHLDGVDMPEVVATRQQGFNLKEYGAANKQLKAPNTKEVEAKINEHADRRGDIDN